MTSVNTNYGALVALQSLNTTNRELAGVQNRVNTGLKVASAADNGAVFAIAEGQRARVLSINAVTDGIDRATSVINVGLSAGEAIGDILKQLKEKSVAAQATDLSQDQRDALNADFSALRDQINQIANAATFNGSNLVNGTNLTGSGNVLNVLTSDAGGGSSNASAGQFVRTTALSGGTVDLDTDVTSATVGGVASTQGFETGDTITIQFTGESTSYVFTFAGGETLGDVLDGINEATNGRLTASLDTDTSEIVYSSADAFSITIDDADGTDDLDQDVTNLFANAGASAAGGGTGNSINYIAGGGFQANGAAAATPLSNLATITDVGAVTSGDNVKFTLYGADEASGGGDDTVFRVTLEGTDTISDYLAAVSQATGGLVTAVYDEENSVITYRSEQKFAVATRNAADGAAATTAALNTFFGGAAAGSTALEAPSSTSASTGANAVALAGFDFRLGVTGQALSGITSSLDISTTTGADTATSAIGTAITSLNKNLASLGAQAKALEVQKNFLGKLSDSIEAGIGNLVDADLAKESARLQALQVKQQLGAQALAIANQAPSIVLSFFR